MSGPLTRRGFLGLFAGAAAAATTTYFLPPIGGWKSDIIANPHTSYLCGKDALISVSPQELLKIYYSPKIIENLKSATPMFRMMASNPIIVKRLKDDGLRFDHETLHAMEMAGAGLL